MIVTVQVRHVYAASDTTTDETVSLLCINVHACALHEQEHTMREEAYLISATLYPPS